MPWKIISTALEDYPYSNRTDYGTMIQLQYADGICWIAGNSQHSILHQKATILELLIERNLFINKSKSEEYVITTTTNTDWHNCRYVGSILDTEKDIKRRKRLAMFPFNNLRPIIGDKKLSVHIKIRIMNALVNTVFLYNSELWTIKKDTSTQIDTFQQKLLRRLLDIRYPQKISNADIYQKPTRSHGQP